MASAMATDTYYCYTCDEQISPITEDYTCPNCQGGFVEKVSEESTGAMMEDMNSASMPSQANSQLVANPFERMLTALLTMPRETPGSDGPGSAESVFRIRYSNPSQRVQSDAVPFLEESSSSTAAPRAQSNAAATTSGNGSGNSISLTPDAFVQEVLQGALGGFEGQLFQFPMSGAHFPWNFMELHGNPSDYAWGPSGLDDIISNLLGQLENAGPPPASKQTIDSLPTIDIDASHVENDKDCSVCMEVFKLNEKAKKLPCSHFFHIPCIEPWLKLHNTCPICRKLVEDSSSCPSTSANNSAGSSYSYFRSSDDHTYAE